RRTSASEHQLSIVDLEPLPRVSEPEQSAQQHERAQPESRTRLDEDAGHREAQPHSDPGEESDRQGVSRRPGYPLLWGNELLRALVDLFAQPIEVEGLIVDPALDPAGRVLDDQAPSAFQRLDRRNVSQRRQTGGRPGARLQRPSSSTATRVSRDGSRAAWNAIRVTKTASTQACVIGPVRDTPFA